MSEQIDKLLTEILSIDDKNKIMDKVIPIADHPIYILELINNTEAKVLAKIREVVEGAKLSEADISDRLWKLAITDMSMVCSIVAKAQTKAILKAIGGE